MGIVIPLVLLTGLRFAVHSSNLASEAAAIQDLPDRLEDLGKLDSRAGLSQRADPYLSPAKILSSRALSPFHSSLADEEDPSRGLPLALEGESMFKIPQALPSSRAAYPMSPFWDAQWNFNSRTSKRRHYISKKSAKDEQQWADLLAYAGQSARRPFVSKRHASDLDELMAAAIPSARRPFISKRSDVSSPSDLDQLLAMAGPSSRRPFVSKKSDDADLQQLLASTGPSLRRHFISKKDANPMDDIRQLLMASPSPNSRRPFISKKSSPDSAELDMLLASGTPLGRRPFISKRSMEDLDVLLAAGPSSGRRPFISKRALTDSDLESLLAAGSSSNRRPFISKRTPDLDLDSLLASSDAYHSARRPFISKRSSLGDLEDLMDDYERLRRPYVSKRRLRRQTLSHGVQEAHVQPTEDDYKRLIRSMGMGDGDKFVVTSARRPYISKRSIPSESPRGDFAQQGEREEAALVLQPSSRQ